MRPENSFGAEWDPSVSGVVVRLSHHNHLLWPEEAKALMDEIGAALLADEDRTPKMGTAHGGNIPRVVLDLRRAWTRFKGDVRHAPTCRGYSDEPGLGGAPRMGCADCTCGLVDLVQRLMGNGEAA